MPRKQLPLRPNVCMLLYNSRGRLFLGERHGKPGHWQFPQGGAEPKYSLKENVIRELREELRIKKSHIGKVKKLSSRHEYEWRTTPSYARNKWRGQKQTFWLIEFIGDDEDIDLAWYKEPEFQSWRWCSVTEVKRRAASFRLAGYRGALREFLAFKREKLQNMGPSRNRAPSKRGKKARPRA